MGIDNFISVGDTEDPKLAAEMERRVREYDVDVMPLQRAEALVAAWAHALVEIVVATGAGTTAALSAFDHLIRQPATAQATETA